MILGGDMVIAATSQRWNPKSAVEPVGEILAAPEIEVDDATRREMEKIFQRREYFHGDGRGHLTLLIRTVTESEGNEVALIAPVVAAVSSAMRTQWTEKGLEFVAAFDRIPLLSILDNMRSLELFRESSLGEYLGISIQNRLWKAFGPDKLPQPPHIAKIEKLMALGLKLAELKSRSCDLRDFGAKLRRCGVSAAATNSEAIRVAMMYSDKPEFYLKVSSWKVLVELSSPLPALARKRFEARVLIGEKVSGSEIYIASRRLPTGRPKGVAEPGLNSREVSNIDQYVG